jgi:hypothetical protein
VAQSLSGQPELMSKMMTFMDRLESENAGLKKERSEQKAKVNELLKDASDHLVKQVNDFMLQKDKEVQETLKNMGGA